MREEIAVRQPRLLLRELASDGARLKEACRLHPLKLALDLNARLLSAATLTLPETDPDLAMHDLVELFTPNGSAGIFRVVGQEPEYGKHRVYRLNHAIDLLSDAICPGEETYAGTVAGFLTKLLAAQTQRLGNTPFWQLGTCADSGAWHREMAYDNVLEDFAALEKERQDFRFVFDFGTFPWTVSFAAFSREVFSEFRMDRNMTRMQPQVSDGGLCTRLYLSVTSKTPVTENSQAVGQRETQTFHTFDCAPGQQQFGVICRAAGIDSEEAPDTQAWAEEYFSVHGAPGLALTLEGEEFVRLTGEPLDEARLGCLCRVAVPQYAVVFNERICSIRYPDLIGSPRKVMVALANKRRTLEGSIASVKKESARAGKTASSALRQARNNKTELNRQSVRFEHKTQVTQEGMEDCFGIIGVKLDPTTHAPLKDENGDYIWAGPNDQPAEIWGHLHRNAWETLIQNNIKDSNGKILSLASVYTDAYGNAIITAINDQRTGQATIRGDRILVGTTSGSYLGIDSDGRIVLTANNAVAAINAATVKINAEQIQLGTYGGSAITLDERISLDTDGYILLKATTIVQGPLDVQGNYSVSARNFVVGTGGYIRLIGAQTGEYYDLTADNMPGCIRDLQFIVDPNNAGHIILQKKTIYNSATWTDAANFNIAATQFYQDGVAAAEARGQSSVGARIVSGNNNVVSGTYAIGSPGGQVTLYPATKVGGTLTRDANYAVTVTAPMANVKLKVRQHGGTTVTELSNGERVTLSAGEYCEVDIYEGSSITKWGEVEAPSVTGLFYSVDSLSNRKAKARFSDGSYWEYSLTEVGNTPYDNM